MAKFATAMLMLVALLATSCSKTSPKSASTTSGKPGNTSALTTSPMVSTAPPKTATTIINLVVPKLEWSECGGGFECTSFDAPLDYAQPTGDTIGLSMVRRPASKPDERIGALFVNPGGPGGSATGLAQRLAGAFPSNIRDRFDIVGIDPRGVGQSSPLDCEGPVAAMYEADPTIETAADKQDLLSTSETFVEACESAAGNELAHLGTRDVARDMDLARQALGDEQLSFFGYSYGTAIGQVYAELFPTNIRAMVLDGVVDVGESGISAATTQAVGFEDALQNFADSCPGDLCKDSDTPIGSIDELAATAEHSPIPAPGANRAAGPAEVVLGLVTALYDESDWSNLARAISEATASDPDGSRLVGLADSYLNRAKFAPYFAVSCLDAAWPDTEQLLADAKATAKVAPHFGEALVNDYVRCSLWPAPAQPLRSISPNAAALLPPIVLVSTTGDPATPYENGVKVSRELAKSSLITKVGEGHTAALQGDDCVDQPIFDYLADLKQTKSEIRCE